MSAMNRELKLYGALHLHGLDYNVQPLWAGKKNPFLKAWKVRQEVRLNRVELRSLFLRNDVDPAIVTGEIEETKVNVVALDFDQPGEFERWPVDTNQVVRSPNGHHVYARLPPGVRLVNRVRTRVLGCLCDIRHHGAYAKAPPGESDTGFTYEWAKGPVNAHDLVLLDRDIFAQEPAPIGRVGNAARRRIGRTFRNVEAWCMKVESVQHCNGSGQLVRVCAALRDAGKTPDEAFDFLWTKWNPVMAKPPWEADAIRRCIERHF